MRNFAEAPGSAVVAVSDLSEERLRPLAARYPTVLLTTDYRELLSDPRV